MPTLDNEKIETVFAMLKGEPGTRKSTAALSFPLPHFWISQDAKMNSLILPARSWGIDLKQIEYDTFDSWGKLDNKLNSLRMNCKYRTIIVDSVTSLADTINLQTLDVKSGTVTKAGSEKGMRIGGIKVNTLEDYKAENSAFTQLIAALKDIRQFHKVNIVLIAHVVGERQVNDNSVTNASRIIITGGKSISGKIPAYCDEVYHFDVKKNPVVGQAPNYIAYTVPTGLDFARTALPLPGMMQIDDKMLWKEFIEPAIKKLNGE